MAKKASDGGPQGDLRIEYMPLSELARWPRNPKAHDLGAISASAQRFGFNDPPSIDEGSKRLVEGHGRVDMLKHAKAEGREPPPRVRVRADGEWLVPVIRGLTFKDEREAEAYLLAHNRTNELGGWDQRDLADALVDQYANLDGIGWSTEDVDKLAARYAEREDPQAPANAGKELDETIADDVPMHECPQCHFRWPQSS